MMRFNDIAGSAREAFDSRFEPGGVRLLADIYWRSLLVVAGTLVACALLYGIWDLFGTLDVLASAADTAPLPPAALDRAALRQTVQGFETRQTRFDDLRSNPPAAIPDPSR